MRVLRTAPSSGFSLIELSIVMLVISILMTGALSTTDAMRKQEYREDTRERLKTLRCQLISYKERNGHFPCPAPLNAVPGTAEFGRAADCEEMDPPPGVVMYEHGFNDKDSDVFEVWRGTVPIRDLNLPTEYSIDSWKKKFTYAVTRELAEEDNKDNNSVEGRIQVEDSNGNSMAPDPEGEAMAYIILSHGANQVGAVGLKQQSMPAPCQLASADAENCDHDHVYRDALYNVTEPNNARYFDDLVVWGMQNDSNCN